MGELPGQAFVCCCNEMMRLRTANRQQTNHMTARFRIEAETLRHRNDTGQSALENALVFPYAHCDWSELHHPHRTCDKAQHHSTVNVRIVHFEEI